MRAGKPRPYNAFHSKTPRAIRPKPAAAAILNSQFSIPAGTRRSGHSSPLSKGDAEARGRGIPTEGETMYHNNLKYRKRGRITDISKQIGTGSNASSESPRPALCRTVVFNKNINHSKYILYKALNTVQGTPL